MGAPEGKAQGAVSGEALTAIAAAPGGAFIDSI